MSVRNREIENEKEKTNLVRVYKPDESVVSSLYRKDRASRGQIGGVFDVRSGTKVSGHSCKQRKRSESVSSGKGE